MLIGEAPGVQEEMMRECWVGKAGKELARYLKQAGIDIRDCWLTNLVKHRPTTRAKSGNVKPTAADIKRDEGELVDEIERVRPTFVVAVGRTAARWFLGNVDMEGSHAFTFHVSLCTVCGRRFQHEINTTRSDSVDSRTDHSTVSGKDQEDSGRAKLLAVDRNALATEQRTVEREVRTAGKAVGGSSIQLSHVRRRTRSNTDNRPSLQQPSLRSTRPPKTDHSAREHSPKQQPRIEECTETTVQVGSSIHSRKHLHPPQSQRTALSKMSTETRARTQFEDCCRSTTIRFVVVVVFHPAAGLHSPEQQPVIYSDFMMLGKYVRGTLPCVSPRDLYPDPDYYEPRSSVRLVKSLPIAVDTEGLAGRVWGLSFSQFGGSAGVIRATNRRAIASMKEQLFR